MDRIKTTSVTASVAHCVIDEPSIELRFEDVFRAEMGNVGRTLRYLGVREALLDDACQEVFLVVHRRLSDFKTGSFRGWIRQICVNVARNQRRTTRRRREDVVEETPEVAAAATQDGDLEQCQLRERLLALLAELPEPQRVVFVLYELEELAMSEVAVAASCPLQTAYSRLHAARAAIKAQIAKEGR